MRTPRSTTRPPTTTAWRWVYWHPVVVLAIFLAGGLFWRAGPPADGTGAHVLAWAVGLSVLPGLVAVVADAVRRPPAPRPGRRLGRFGRARDVAVAVMLWGLADAAMGLPLACVMRLVAVPWVEVALLVVVPGLVVAFVVLVLVFVAMCCGLLALAVHFLWTAARAYLGPAPATAEAAAERRTTLGTGVLLTGVMMCVVVLCAMPGATAGVIGSPRGRGAAVLLRLVVWAWVGGGPSLWLWLDRAALAGVLGGLLTLCGPIRVPWRARPAPDASAESQGARTRPTKHSPARSPAEREARGGPGSGA